jgi:hypothetical protein
MDNLQLVIVAAEVATQKLLAAYSIIFDDVLTRVEHRRAKKRKRELTSYKRNVSLRYGNLTTNLEPIPVLDQVLHDENRAYMYNITHLHPWQFFILADRLEHLILRPRLRRDGTRPNRHGHTMKQDHYHRVFLYLKWLNDGNFYRTREAETGWGKSSYTKSLLTF